MPSLFDPIQVGSIKANNRVFMAPLTRARATRESVPTDLMVTYYSQRATAGLIVSEATAISEEGRGWAYSPGIWNKEQIEAWKPVTKAVHDKGGKIVLQLWHMGRAAHSNVTGMQPVSASATTYPGQLHTFDGKKDPEVARELTKEDIKRIVGEYAQGAKNAIEAGFDGVQIHAANGYLIDQFLRNSANFRTDEYGGSIENRMRLLDEVTTAVVEAVGADRTGVRLSPNGDAQGIVDSDPEPLFRAVAELLQKKNIAFLGLRENSPTGTFWGATEQPKLGHVIRSIFKNTVIFNQDYTREQALKDVETGACDAISFGRPIICNPDLVAKLRDNKPLRVFNDQVKWWYQQGPEGYIDFPEGSD